MRSLAALTMLLFCAAMLPVLAHASCTAPANAIEAENCLPGTPASTWDISGAGDSTIQGFTTDISFNVGQTVSFKVNTPATSSQLDIYRMGYYQGNGARKVATVNISGAQNQPACLTNSTGLYDCGNWSVSATWPIPANAVSGIYFARAIRNDTGGASHIFFIVRNDSSTSDILFKTSDTTWQAYNDQGGANFYVGGPGPQGGAYKISYNRPFHTRVYEFWSWVFNAEYPMVRFLEANGYDVSYFTSVDADRFGSLILQHKALLSVGHDEYWSGAERANVEAARAAGVHMAFITGNGIFWKTRWENSIDGSNTPYRTLVCYKETHANKVIDPQDPPTWTGTWRDPRFSPPADGGRPENALQGTIFYVNGPGPVMEIKVPSADGKMRFWRGTAVANLAPNATYTTSINALGYEWDIDIDNGFRPAGLFGLSTATYSMSSNYLQDYGSTYGSGTATHRLVMYRYVNGTKSALVFGSGTSQWPWGLDGNHDGGTTTPDINLKQATVNLFADMGIQPASLQSGLLLASASTDTVAPVSTITSPANGATITPGSTVIIQGTAADTGGVVAGVEVSTDNGATWHPASGRANWTYTWIAAGNLTTTIRSRAVDDSGNLETTSAGVTVTVGAGTQTCPCTIWPSSSIPARADQGADSPVELGVRFKADVNGSITGIRFYKSSANTGTHVGNLWSNSGTLLASATFTNETASGWQQVNFSTPVAITAGTVYVASYHTNVGHYAEDNNYFATSGFDNPPLHALQAGVSGFNGAYAYGSSSVFPNQDWLSSNYWVDVVFSPGATATLQSITVSPVNPTVTAGNTQQFTATGNYSDGSTQNLTNLATWSSSVTGVASINATGLATAVAGGSTVISATSGTISGSTTLTVQPAPLVITTTSLPNGVQNQSYSVTLTGKGGTAPYNWSVATGSTLPSGLTLSPGGLLSGTLASAGTFSFTVQLQDGGTPPQVTTQTLSLTVVSPPASVSIWTSSTVPATPDSGPDSAVELGVKFKADVNGSLLGIRFYKSTANTGTHVANLWTATGTLLATAAFTNETASGWQQVNFASPVSITANTVYVASYHTSVGHYADDQNYFLNAGVDVPPLHLLQNGVSGFNGVYAYGASSVFPSQGFNASNYWVDVVFAPANTTTPPTVNSVSPINGSTGVNPSTGVTAAFSQAMNASTITPATFQLRDPNNNAVPATVSYNSSNWTATLQPSAPLAFLTTYSAVVISGAAGVKDLNGNAMTADYSWSFTTAAAPPPLTVASVSLTPTVVTGGTSSTGTVTLSTAAPSGGIAVSLTSSNPGAASVPSSVTVLAGATTATFTVTTVTVTTATTADITATYGSSSAFATLSVNPPGALAIDVTTFKDRSTNATNIVTPAFSTKSANELLLAFISTDAKKAGITVTSVTGAGLTWSLVVRANKQMGTAEIWRAFAPAALTNATVTANLSQSTAASITVMSFTGASTAGTGGSGAIGAIASVSAASGAPAASLVTTRNNSWVLGVGNDWTSAIPRTLGPNQTMVHQYLAAAGDTFWVQRQTATTPLAGTTVTINDTAPVADTYNLSICEVLPQ
jgi:hypothetical protein